MALKSNIGNNCSGNQEELSNMLIFKRYFTNLGQNCSDPNIDNFD